MRVSSSFRDPSGYVFEENGTVYRKVSPQYEPVLTQLVGSGLCNRLTGDKLLLPFRWVGDTLEPERVPFISYPYEWSFSMLKDAALLTLRVQKIALRYGIILKDASAYNVQFVGGEPILIDHLSFYPYEEGKPWVAYRQFCQHFLNPLVLATYRDIRLLQLLKTYIDGIPANLTNKLLPVRAKLNLGILMHVKLNSLDGRVSKVPKMSKLQLTALIGNLESTVRHFRWEPKGIWESYDSCSYSENSYLSKRSIVSDFLSRARPKLVWDLGANVGEFSLIASNLGSKVVSIDSDPACTEIAYKKGDSNVLPLTVDLTNPSPAIGWGGTERDSFISRLGVGTVMVLALIHHLAIGNNLPLDRISSFLAKMSKYLIIEWVPKEDSQVQKMLKFREDIFPSYTKEGFEEAFGKDFSIEDCKQIEGSLRSIYLMEAR